MGLSSFGRTATDVSIPTCPSPEDHILKYKVNHHHELVAEYPNPEHMQRLKTIDTSGW